MAFREKRMPWQTLLIVALPVLMGGIFTLALLSAASRRRPSLGVHEGKLLPLESPANGVSSLAKDESRIAPLRFDDSPAGAWARLKQMMEQWPRTRIVSVDEDYLRAECATRLLRFLDDVEFLLDREAQVIHVRASCRVGRSDLGVNRQRMEKIRRAFEGK
jgi:uncharacterized protein (DUF1499 family)